MLHYFERVASTQDAAHDLAAAGAPHGTAVLAAEQTRGRGSRGRAWVSPRGGLWLSIVLRPPDATAAEVMSLRAALAACQTLERLGVGGVRIKWPNDLLLGDRKLAGILCEGRWAGDRPGWVVLGVGMNVCNALPEGVGATSLAEQGIPLRPDELASPLIAAFSQLGGGSLEARELEAYAHRDWLAGRTIAEPLPGTARGIAADGRLAVQQADGVVRWVAAGTVVAPPARENPVCS